MSRLVEDMKRVSAKITMMSMRMPLLVILISGHSVSHDMMNGSSHAQTHFALWLD